MRKPRPSLRKTEDRAEALIVYGRLFERANRRANGRRVERLEQLRLRVRSISRRTSGAAARGRRRGSSACPWALRNSNSRAGNPFVEVVAVGALDRMHDHLRRDGSVGIEKFGYFPFFFNVATRKSFTLFFGAVGIAIDVANSSPSRKRET